MSTVLTRRGLSLFAAIVAVVTLVALAAPETHADPRNFTLINDSSITISHVYVAASASNDWGDDILGRDVLLPGESVDILFSRFDGEAGVCLYDIMVMGKDGEEGYLYGVDLCNTLTVTFR
jgi:hypothetical protein